MGKGGSIRKKDNRWLWVGYYRDNTGKIFRPTKSFKTKKEAEAYLKLQAKENKHIKNLRDNKNYTVNEFYAIWKTLTKWDTEEFYSSSTTKSWRAEFRNHILPFIGNEKLQNIDYTKLQEHFNVGNLSQKTYKNIISDIKSMLDFARNLDEDLIIVDNLKKLKIMSKKKPTSKVFNLLSETDYTAIQKHLDEKESHYANLILFLHDTGLRIEEALAVKLEDINIEASKLDVSRAVKRIEFEKPTIINGKAIKSKLVESNYLKTSSAFRSVPLNLYAKRAIKNQIKMLTEKGIKSKYLFPTKNGKPSDPRNVLRTFHTTIEHCNETRLPENYIPKRGLHSLRKLYCKRLKDKSNLEWEVMARILGHSNSEVTKRYYYSISDDDILEISKLLDSSDERLVEERHKKQLHDPEADAFNCSEYDSVIDEDGNILYIPKHENDDEW